VLVSIRGNGEEVKAYLAERHVDGAVRVGGGHTGGSARTHSSSDTSLRRAFSLSTAAAEETGNTSGTAAASSSFGAASTAATAEEAGKELPLICLGCCGSATEVVFHTSGARGALVGRRGSSGAHEGGDHDGGIDVTVALSAAERTGLAGGDLTVAYNGSVGLGTAAAGVRLVSKSECEGQQTYLEEQSRGVPSATVRPGIVTPLAPFMETTTPCAEA
jgi:hypothetical protein